MYVLHYIDALSILLSMSGGWVVQALFESHMQDCSDPVFDVCT